MSKENIQKHECQVIRDVFDRAGDMKKVMVVGIDPAEKEHKAVVCNGFGDLLCKPFSIVNDQTGLGYFDGRLQGLCRKHGVNRESIVLGIENPGPWGENFADHLVQRWDNVIELDPRLAKRFRENQTSDNDRLAAESVCRCLIQKQGRERESDDEYTELLMMVRHYQKLTVRRTGVSNRIHAAADILFPGILASDATDITPLGNASLDILEKLSVHRVKRMSIKQLTEWLKRRKALRAGQQAEKLKTLAARTIPPSRQKERINRLVMQDLVAQYRLLSEQLERALRKMAELLRQTPHWLLTTIDGIGVSTAAQMTAELFARSRQATADSKVNYAGLISRTHQTGGDDKPQESRGRPFSFNHRAKRIVLMAAENVAQHDRSDLAEHFEIRNAAGKNAKYSLGRKLIRFATKLRDAPEVYLPEVYRDGQIGESMRDQYYQNLLTKLERKWGPYIHNAPSEDTDLFAAWIKSTKSLYGLKSSLCIDN